MYKRKMQKIPYNLQNRLYFMDEMKEIIKALQIKP